MFAQEGSYDLMSVFQEMAWEANLLNTKIHEVQEVLASWQELKSTKPSQRDIQFFCMVSPTELPNIMELKGIHFPKALHWWGSHSYYPWCGKEKQNKGTVINHLWTVHYHLGLICALCCDFFAISGDIMRWHMPSLCPQPLRIGAQKRRGRIQRWQWWWGWWVPTGRNLIPEF